jgi:metal-dependent amidase/aminoacylase/carboxypeptidase family protein
MVGPAGTIAGRTSDHVGSRQPADPHVRTGAPSIDPVVMAAATVIRLQTIVFREVAAAEAAVVKVGALQAGTQ